MENSYIIPYSIAALAIILGFVALLAQRIYIDKDTEKASEVNIPVLGKMKTNYPALVFSFLGCFIMLYTLNTQQKHHELVIGKQSKDTWTVKVSFVGKNNKKLGCSNEAIAVKLANFDLPTPTGANNFTIKGDVKKGKHISNVIDYIVYDCGGEGFITIDVKDEYVKYMKNPSLSKITTLNETEHIIKFENVEVD